MQAAPTTRTENDARSGGVRKRQAVCRTKEEEDIFLFQCFFQPPFNPLLPRHLMSVCIVCIIPEYTHSVEVPLQNFCLVICALRHVFQPEVQYLIERNRLLAVHYFLLVHTFM